MASIHRDGNKPNWFCCFYDPEGFRRKRSAGTDNGRVARVICAAVDRASRLARDNKLSNEKGLKLIRDTCQTIEEAHGKLAATRAHDVLKGYVEEFVKIAGGELESYTVKSWLDSWVASRTDTSKATQLEYSRAKELFLKFLGARANRPLTALQSKPIEEFKLELTKQVAPSTVNKVIKILKASFNNAVAKRQLEFSPAEHIDSIDVDEAHRRPFTNEELSNLVKVADADWRTMILIAFYTGLRLGDCANLTWRNIELHQGTLNIQTEKTGRRQILPMAEPLSRHLQKLAGDDPDAPLCPTLFGKTSSTLSNQFYDVMVEAQIAQKRHHKSKGKG
ncbi:MAG: hypothetical protein RLY20_452, partial [Verrucomicrobiota bacterium]